MSVTPRWRMHVDKAGAMPLQFCQQSLWKDSAGVLYRTAGQMNTPQYGGTRDIILLRWPDCRMLAGLIEYSHADEHTRYH